MRIALIQRLGYLPARRGGSKSNRALIEALAARGHACLVVIPFTEEATEAEEMQSIADLEGRAAYRRIEPTIIELEHQGVQVVGYRHDAFEAIPRVMEMVRAFGPDCGLVSCEDNQYYSLLQATLLTAAWPIAYVVHTVETLPMGPASIHPDPHGQELLARCQGIIVVSDFVGSYLQRFAGLDSTTLRFPVYGPGPHRNLARYGEGLVTLINPGVFKGVGVLVELARRMPDVRFGVVPNRWDTSATDLAELEGLSNVTLLGRAEDMDRIFEQVSVLLAPSIGPEAFGLVVVEAMLRGIPVLASDQGGLPEAKLGVDYVLPVRPLEWDRSSGKRTPQHVPQDVGPWEPPLRTLLEDRQRYEALSLESFDAAHAFLAGVGCEPFERFLRQLSRAATPG